MRLPWCCPGQKSRSLPRNLELYRGYRTPDTVNALADMVSQEDKFAKVYGIADRVANMLRQRSDDVVGIALIGVECVPALPRELRQDIVPNLLRGKWCKFIKLSSGLPHINDLLWHLDILRQRYQGKTNPRFLVKQSHRFKPTLGEKVGLINQYLHNVALQQLTFHLSQARCRL
jgi:hypothetical protein